MYIMVLQEWLDSSNTCEIDNDEEGEQFHIEHIDGIMQLQK